MPRKENENPLFAQRIRDLRKKLGLNQIQFAGRLNTDQGTLSKWESGKLKPQPEMFLRIAREADGTDFLYFIEQSGVPSDFFYGSKIPKTLKMDLVHTVAEALSPEHPMLDVQVPYLEDPVAAGNPRNIDQNAIVDYLPFRKRFLPVGGNFYAFKVRGDSMAPIVNDGYVIIVDINQRDPKKLIGHMVAAREGDGVTIKWLRKDKGEYLLVPQHVSQHIPVRIMRHEDDWEIVGVVVKWIGYPDPIRK